MTESGLRFQLKLPPFRTGGRVTTAAFAVRFDGEPLWPVPGEGDIALEIQIDDLLSHLVECWQPLALRQTYPIAVAPDRPLDFRAEAEKRWEQQPAEVAQREDEIVCQFEDVHDLSRCFAGYFELSPLFLMRRGEKLIIDTRAGARAVDFHAAWDEISRFGERIADRLARAGGHWARLVAAWRDRDIGDPISLLAWSTSLVRGVAETFAREGILSAPDTLSAAANDNDELRIAARMASALPTDQIRSILEIVNSFRKASTLELDRLADETSKHVTAHFLRRRAHEQGEAAARFVRDRIGLPAGARFDVDDVLRAYGVELEPRSVEPAALRALAVWGRAHGPSVLINAKGRARAMDRDPLREWSSRVDLAHEFCHLLLDRGHALGAVEILNSRMPIDIERRAKSFAGELLLPTDAAADVWRRQGAPRSLSELKSLTFELQKEYGVTRSVASWKLQHATQRFDVDVSAILATIAPER